MDKYFEKRIKNKADIIIKPTHIKANVSDETYEIIKLRGRFLFRGELINHDYIFDYEETIELYNYLPNLNMVIIRDNNIYHNFNIEKTYKYYFKEY